MKILIHACCAPCLIHPYDLFTGRGYEVVPYFYNPNIHPFREYRERYFAALDYASEKGIKLRAGPYEMERFLAEAPSPAGERCEVCYRMRLGRSAAEARALGIARFTTTLLVSPYQDQEKIGRAGRAAAAQHGVEFIFEDMSSGYRESVRISREAGMYRQKYCGCVYSEKERFQKSDPPGEI
ncbi:MAG: epoxyqueuosine reductase QueH [Actinobacteria bacterium]|nr:epoxyqueuosine reductase QueH [Actinomycetota bacterium]MBU4218604.1 epoxyqueuosine reductase QueH [Actinomycetota bacterium]MBU4359868.1 epoxyqueuosine reductase QueH [Actinomycetota bacterium]MCG2818708.1 epoxyqueuosine reductase QueH [Actinomycetes bacterium]